MPDKLKTNRKKEKYLTIKGSKLPLHPLTNFELIRYVKKFKIPYFRGVFKKDQLPANMKTRECGIVNLDSEDGEGTHWVAYKRNFDQIFYFDSYGNLPPPLELIEYFKGAKDIFYNYDTFQKGNQIICGHLCLRFLLYHFQL